LPTLCPAFPRRFFCLKCHLDVQLALRS
jgi:hypothetical protein